MEFGRNRSSDNPENERSVDKDTRQTIPKNNSQARRNGTKRTTGNTPKWLWIPSQEIRAEDMRANRPDSYDFLLGVRIASGSLDINRKYRQPVGEPDSLRSQVTSMLSDPRQVGWQALFGAGIVISAGG